MRDKPRKRRGLGMLRKVKLFFLPPDFVLASQVLEAGLTEVSVFGIGELGTALVGRLKEQGIIVNYWYDSNVSDSQHNYMGCSVYHISKVASQTPKTVVIASEAFEDDMINTCLSYGYNGRILSLSGNN